ncbi:MAG: hypothetical protein ACT4NV_00110 [Rhodoferax sp.]
MPKPAPSTMDTARPPPTDTLRQLERAWKLLSGQRRPFVPIETALLAPAPFPEFSYMLAIGQPRHGHHKGVLVLLDRVDAERVTRHMFGHHHAPLAALDICDAGREVCNVFADCVSHLIAERGELRTGLPQRLDAPGFEALRADSGFSHAFASPNPDGTIQVVVVGVLAPDFPTRPCPL